MRRAFAPAAARALAMAAIVAPIGAAPGLADSGNVVLTSNVKLTNSIPTGWASARNVTAQTMPAALRGVAITGLNNVEGPRLYPQTHALPGTVAARPSTLSPSADMNLTTPPALWSIYDQPGNNKGEGQQMAIFGWGTTNNTINDLRSFEREYSLPSVPVTISYYGTETAITDSGD